MCADVVKDYVRMFATTIREMALEDGRFLVSPLRYDKLLMVSKLTNVIFCCYLSSYMLWPVLLTS